MNAPAMEPTFDMDSPAFASDEFRVFEFKVKRCPRVRAHDWTECPFAHPGEKARRRDPRRYAYCGTACPDFRKGVCRRGDACEFAHGVFECWLHPSRYRTQLCTDGKDCARRVCFFAHVPEELRAPDTSGCPQPSPTGRPASPTAPPLPSPLPSSNSGAGNMVYGIPQTSMHAQAAAAAASAQQQAATHAAVAALLGANMHTPAQQAAAALLASSGDPTVQALLAATIRQQQDQQNAYARQLQQALAAQAAGALPSVHQLAAAAAAASAVAQARAVQGAGVLMSSFGEIGTSPAYALPEMSDAGANAAARRRDIRRTSCPEVNGTGGVVGAPSKEALALLLAQQDAKQQEGVPTADFEQSMEQAFQQLQIEAEVNAARMGEVPVVEAAAAAPPPPPRSNGTNPASKPFKPRNPAIENLVANLPRTLSDLALDRHGDFVEELVTV